MARVPSVVMSALMPMTVTQKPLMTPMSNVPRTATRKADETCRLSANGRSTPPVPGASAETAMSMPAKPTPEPTDRSNWPEMSSSVAGQAMMPTTATFCRMLMRFSELRKNSEEIEKYRNSAASTMSSAAVSGMASPRRRVAAASWTTSSPVPGVAAAGAGVAP
jgi:hypothetical protein